MKFQRIETLNATLVAVAVAVVLGGCSAGGKDNVPVNNSPGGGNTTLKGTVTESLSSNTVSSATPATVTATVRDASGNAVSGTVVTFTAGPLGSLSSATALTNSSGVATVSLSPATAATTGADTVVATAVVGTDTLTASQGYQLSATTAAFASFSSNIGTASTDKLAAYAQALLTLNLTGVSSAAPATVNLTSQCVVAGKATISPVTAALTSNTASFTYKDNGCGATLPSDTVTATIAGSGTTTTDQVFLTSPTPNSITFTSATPATIYLKGSGYTESSSVKFQVVDTSGNPLPGQRVSLALSTLAGGLQLDQQTGVVHPTSDANGFVTAIVNSGTVPTPVRVTATLDSGVTTVSSQLSVATGLPTQLHFSLAEKTMNIEGGELDGTPNTYTARAADRSGNPVPDGTAVLFWAEGGQIQASSTTSTTGNVSSATASFVSQAFRPTDGRVTVLAYSIGEESFIDLNGTNVYQAGDPFQDLGDVVKSRQFDNQFDAANDETISLSLSGGAAGTGACINDTANYPQFALDQLSPNKPNTCDGVWSARTYVRKAIETVFSTSHANPLWPSTAGLASGCSPSTKLFVAPKTIDTTGPHNFYPIATNRTWYTGNNNASGSFSLIPADTNGVRLNPMPAGTLITALPDDPTVLALDVVGGSPVPNSTETAPVLLSYKIGGGLTSSSGTISFTTPSGIKSTVPFIITEGAPPSTCP